MSPITVMYVTTYPMTYLTAAGGEENGSPGSDPAGRGEEGQSYATAKSRVLGNVSFIGECHWRCSRD